LGRVQTGLYAFGQAGALSPRFPSLLSPRGFFRIALDKPYPAPNVLRHVRKVYRIETTRRFERDFNKLDPSISHRVMKKIDQLAAHPEAVTQRLRNPPPDMAGVHKYRVGDYRILLWVDYQAQVLTLHAVAHRREIYRGI
jgi:mRNA interferase RelE/StbE